MNKEEALKLALEALKDLLDQTEPPPDTNCSCHICPPCNDCVDYSGVRYAIEQANKTITAIKEALAQPTSGDYALGYAEGFNDACKRQPERTGWPAGLLQDDDRKLSKWLASKPDAKHVVDMAQSEQNDRRLQIAMRQWEDWKAYALELQKKLVKYEGGSPMMLNTQPQEKNT